jgi:hypothetical protein
MEVFLSKQTTDSFSALQYGLTKTNTDGFLIGHKRGDLFFIEKIFPSQKSFFSSEEEFFTLKQKLDDKILGFYSFQTTEVKLKKILKPIGYGKIFLRLDRDKRNQWITKSYVIEYDQDFYLLPVGPKSA